MRSIPNGLAIARAVAVVPVVVLIGEPGLAFWAFAVFSVAALTDALDGWLARRLNAATPLGAFLDPLADKILVLGTLLALLAQERVDPWVVVVLLGREGLAVALRSAGALRGVAIEAGALGKAKTILQAVAVAGMLVALVIPGYGISALAAVVLGLAVALTLASGAELIVRAAPLFRADRKHVAIHAR